MTPWDQDVFYAATGKRDMPNALFFSDKIIRSNGGLTVIGQFCSFIGMEGSLWSRINDIFIHPIFSAHQAGIKGVKTVQTIIWIFLLTSLPP